MSAVPVGRTARVLARLVALCFASGTGMAMVDASSDFQRARRAYLAARVVRRLARGPSRPCALEGVAAAADGDRSRLSVFMCGPREMLRSFQTQLRLADVPANRIHREYFDWR